MKCVGAGLGLDRHGGSPVLQVQFDEGVVAAVETAAHIQVQSGVTADDTAQSSAVCAEMGGDIGQPDDADTDRFERTVRHAAPACYAAAACAHMAHNVAKRRPGFRRRGFAAGARPPHV